jgi:RNA polymerase sigma-70 factor (ECF subfamily)
MDSRAQFEALYRAHCGTVRSFIHRRVSVAAADDAVADVFLVAWRRLDEAPDDELAWLLQIARGVLANRRRGETRQVALRDRLAGGIGAGSWVEPGPELLADGGSDVMRAFARLSRLDQEVLLMVAWDGLERAQAARVLGITTGVFSVRLHRARRRLQRALAIQEGAVEQDAGYPPAVEEVHG